MIASRFRVILYTMAAISLVAILGSEPEIYFYAHQQNAALANIFEGDFALYRTNAPVRTASRPDNSSAP
jgi:hypothetical protein